MLDHCHRSPLRVGHRTRRRAATRSRPFNIMDTNSTKSEWEEVVREIPRMWEQDGLLLPAASTSPCRRRTTCCPSPTGRGTRRSGSRAATRRRSGRRVSSVSGRSPSTSSRSTTCEAGSRPTRRASPNCEEPLGQFMNDNVMMTNGVLCFEDRTKARRLALRHGSAATSCHGQPVPRHDAEVARRHHVAGRSDQLEGSGREAILTSSSTADRRWVT